MNDAQETAYLSAKALARRFSTTERTVWRWVESGHLPKPVQIGNGGCTRWLMAEIAEWERSRISKRRGQ